MPKNHVKFHSTDGKRSILLVDAADADRQALCEILEDTYHIRKERNGQEALAFIREHSHTLSLVMADSELPGLNGLQLLTAMRADPDMARIPVIFMTADRKLAVEGLSRGAIDFIPKPYPYPEVIQARILRTIELSEGRDIIGSTERDPLTGLYNRDYFFRYAAQFDEYHQDMMMDAVVMDVNAFHMINERYGQEYGDKVLRRIGEDIRDMVRESGGIVCRREADTFLVYCPHRTDYEEILRKASAALAESDAARNRVMLRMGVYPNVDKAIDIERRFDRAKMASNMVRGSYTKSIGYYDNTLHEARLYEAQLLEDFHRAILQEEFVVHYQPKFSIRPEIPVLSSAEALVRWIHPTLGMISPGVFVPLFEKSGLIQELDLYVWRKAAAQIREWKTRFDITVPVSVNVSRIDLYDPELIHTLQNLLEEYGLVPEEFLLEITESAYTRDSEQIIEAANILRDLGFRIEMDDFGTGYSSLNMLSRLPIDALKLDMQFIRSAFSGDRDTRMVEMIIDIADYLSVPVIAEGVETEEQLQVLKDLGCDLVQGFYFARPLPASEYESFVQERQKIGPFAAGVERVDPIASAARRRREMDLSFTTHSLTSGFESIYYVDTETDRFVQFSGQGRFEDLQIQRSGGDFFGDLLENVRSYVYPEDRTRVALSVEKQAVLAHLAREHRFSITYRMMIEGKPVYYNIKAVRADINDPSKLVVGISNVDDQIHPGNVGHQEVDKKLDFFRVAYALSDAFEAVYYVDLTTGAYTEFTAEGEYEKLPLHIEGKDFFEETADNIKRVVFRDDQKNVAEQMGKVNLLRRLESGGIATLSYRLVIRGEVVHYKLKMARMNEDRHKVVISVGRDTSYELERTVSYSAIAKSLAADYFSIYYVDLETEEFTQYTAHTDYMGLEIEDNGVDFFATTRRNVLRVVYQDDVERALAFWHKETLVPQLEGGKPGVITYRLIMDGRPVYVEFKVTLMKGQEDAHMVVGISNVDEQVRRELELGAAKALANRDALTGVKSKHAYDNTVRELNKAIVDDVDTAFAVVVCDVNELKRVNDTVGHAAGDQYIREACMMVCKTFTHSPVFRIGGDEFVAILRGADYDNRLALMDLLAERNRQSREEAAGGSTLKPVVASGMAEYLPGRDTTVEEVFRRADEIMYERKRQMKK